jgi:hypothetical protein
MPQSFGIRARAGVVGMLKLASKFAMDIFPSVIATILGAYIVNHYIKAPSNTAATAAAISTADPKKAALKADSKPAERSADLGNMPEPGVRAKGISEKSVIDKSAADKPATDKATDKADRPSETASIPPVAPADTRHHQSAPRDKAASKTPPPTASAPAAEPVVAAPVTAPPAEPAAATPDANDLARAAIERLRGTDPVSRTQDSARAAEPSKAVEPPHVATAPAALAPVSVPVVAAPSLQPLPPPILVSTPPVDNKPAARADDPLRPTPPADIPDPHAPLDLRAEAAVDHPPKRPSVADDVLSAAKSMFNSVLPKQQQ